MTDPNQAELRAFDAASECAGQFIETMGITDMAQWTGETWASFIATVCGGYVDSVIDQQMQAQDAMRKVMPHS